MESTNASDQALLPRAECGDKDYNDVFERLVDGFDEGEQLDEKLVGMLAYALYKECKREFVSSFVRKHGRRPDPSDVSIWTTGAQVIQLETLKQAARSKLYTFAYGFHHGQLDEYRDSVDTELRQKHFSALHGRLDSHESLFKAQIDGLRSETSSVIKDVDGLGVKVSQLVTATGAWRALGWNVLGGFLGTVFAILIALAVQSRLGQQTLHNMVPTEPATPVPSIDAARQPAT
jgi:hypothetical protein